MMHYYGMGYGMAWGWIFQILILVLFFLVIWWIIKGNKFGFGSDEDALGILKRRLAKGEISQKEYERLKKDIQQDGNIQ